MTKWYVSDTHFFHDLMLSPTLRRPRPFASVGEMNEALIENWNRVVHPKDLVIHLGDFSFKPTEKQAEIVRIFNRLNGRKRLIIGNHDLDRHGDLHPTLAALPWDGPPRWMAEDNDDGGRTFLCHYAMKAWPGQNKGAVHFFGHSHGGLIGEPNSRDVGVDVEDTGYAPRTFRQLVGGLRDD